MTTITLILWIFIIILVVMIILLIGTNVELAQTLIEPGNCPRTRGDFGVLGAKSYQSNGALASINKCGASGVEICQATANTIGEAITYCNTYVNVCDAFVYSVVAKSVIIVDPTATLSNDVTYDLFQRQYPINITD
jgi:hypothetical protein